MLRRCNLPQANSRRTAYGHIGPEAWVSPKSAAARRRGRLSCSGSSSMACRRPDLVVCVMATLRSVARLRRHSMHRKSPTAPSFRSSLQRPWMSCVGRAQPSTVRFIEVKQLVHPYSGEAGQPDHLAREDRVRRPFLDRRFRRMGSILTKKTARCRAALANLD